MSSPPTFDFDELLAPISEDAPSGVSLKDDPAGASLYYQIKDAREAARAAERAALRADEDDPLHSAPQRPDWQHVVRLTKKALQTETKDLWIAAWLLEGLTRQFGFAGLRDGFILIREMCARYWDSIHPRPDSDGVTTTVAQLAGLNGEGTEGALIAPIGAILITGGTSVGPFTGRDYIDAEKVALMADAEARAKRIAQGAITMEMFQTAAGETSPQFFETLLSDITAAIDEFHRLMVVLEEKCGTDEHGYSAAPASSQIAAALRHSQARVRALAGKPESTEIVESPGQSNSVLLTSSGLAIGAVQAREEAFRALLTVADYFRRTEPHSPLSYALEQAVRWGRMPLPDLIRELLPDDSSRREFCKRTGISENSN